MRDLMPKASALVADDEMVVRRLCSRILEALNYRTVTASHGLEALKAIEEQPFEVVIADLRMPDLDGIQLLKSIKRISPKTDVIVITGYATLENAIEAMKEGAVDYLRKPFSAEELQMAIQKCQDKRRLTEEKTELPEMMGIYELSTALSSTMLLEEIMGLFLDLTTRLLRSPKALLFLVDSHRADLYLERSKGLPESRYRGLRLGLGESKLGQALNREKTCLLESHMEDVLFRQFSENGENPKSLLCAPLLARGKIVGGLLLYPKDSGEPFTPGDEKAISIMANQAAIAIENARLLEAHQKRIAELTKINGLAKTLESHSSDVSFFPSLVRSLEGLFDYDLCVLLMPLSEEGKLNSIASPPLTEAFRQELKEKMVKEFNRHAKKMAKPDEFEVTFFPRGSSPLIPPLARLGSTLYLPLSIKDHPQGVIGFVRAKEEPFDQITVRAVNTITSFISLALENQQLYTGIRGSYLSTVRALSAAVEAKDPYTRDHSFFTAKFAKALAKQIGLPREKVDEITVAALLHDIGKIGIPESILGKADKLSPEEYQNMQRHPVIGGKILESVKFPWELKAIVLSHHEHFDGNGYPSGLKGEEIPLGARILGIAEAYEMMISGRPYKKPLTRAEAAQHLTEYAGTQFDPQLIPPFLVILSQGKED